MNNLIYKYRKDELSPEELLELRRQINAMSDSEIERQMHDGWLNDDIDASWVEDERMSRIKDNITLAIKKKHTGLSLLIRWGQMAAAILMPVFIALSFYLYHQNNLIISEEMIVSTGKGERTSITLPDGTQVALNSESRLAYRTTDYNKKERKISFAGEGYFQVQKNKEAPFQISSRGMEIKVLGTTFNLLVREKNTTAELTLEEGSVQLFSVKRNKSVVLVPNQKAILDQQTGKITVINDNDTGYSSAWRRGDMVFRNTSLSDVIQSIEENYNVTIEIACVDCIEDTFTGTLPLTNLNEVLEVLEKSYNIQATIVGREIHLN